MSARILIYVGGTYQLLWVFAHLQFPKQLDWDNALSKLDDFNRILMLIFSKLLLFFYLGTALICFMYARELLETNIGMAILLFLSAYWLVRALLQVQYFGFKRANTVSVRGTASAMWNGDCEAGLRPRGLAATLRPAAGRAARWRGGRCWLRVAA